MNNTKDEKFLRWQERLLEQRGTMNSLLLAIGVAALGYQVNLVFEDDNFCFYGWDKFYYEFSIPLIFLSITFGLGMGLTRLIDYRLTAKLNRIRVEAPDRKTLKQIRKRASFYGKVTQGLFGFQVAALILAFLLITAFYIVRYCHLFY